MNERTEQSDEDREFASVLSQFSRLSRSLRLETCMAIPTTAICMLI